MVASVPGNPKQQPRFWRASQPVRFRHLLGDQPLHRGGSLHESGQSCLVAGGHQPPHQRHELFQRFKMDQLPQRERSAGVHQHAKQGHQQFLAHSFRAVVALAGDSIRSAHSADTTTGLRKFSAALLLRRNALTSPRGFVLLRSIGMNSLASAVSARLKYPPGFRPRRGLNWFILGLMYASFYMCRYNFRFATPGMVEEFHFNTFQITSILSAWSVAYGFGQLLNGLLTDRIGGRTAMLI